ncbi:MAG: hypothetical protein HOP11_04085, partial [Saprospiraceae bacterium]|nr:hypothetical protein [Saprospiraceae bacterium]
MKLSLIGCLLIIFTLNLGAQELNLNKKKLSSKECDSLSIMLKIKLLENSNSAYELIRAEKLLWEQSTFERIIVGAANKLFYAGNFGSVVRLLDEYKSNYFIASHEADSINLEADIVLSRSLIYSQNYSQATSLLDSLIHKVKSKNHVKFILKCYDASSELYYRLNKFREAKSFQELADSIVLQLDSFSKEYQYHLQYSVYFNSLLKQYEKALKSNTRLLHIDNSSKSNRFKLLYDQGWLYNNLFKYDSADLFLNSVALNILSESEQLTLYHFQILQFYAANLVLCKKYTVADSICQILEIHLNRYIHNENNVDLNNYLRFNTLVLLTRLEILQLAASEVHINNLFVRLEAFINKYSVDENIMGSEYSVLLSFLLSQYSKTDKVLALKCIDSLISLLERSEINLQDLTEEEKINYLINYDTKKYNILFNYSSLFIDQPKYLKWLFDFSLQSKGISFARSRTSKNAESSFNKVKKTLGKHEIAVNFYKFNREKIVNKRFVTTQVYMALVASGNSENPYILELFEESKLDSLINSRAKKNEPFDSGIAFRSSLYGLRPI